MNEYFFYAWWVYFPNIYLGVLLSVSICDSVCCSLGTQTLELFELSCISGHIFSMLQLLCALHSGRSIQRILPAHRIYFQFCAFCSPALLFIYFSQPCFMFLRTLTILSLTFIHGTCTDLFTNVLYPCISLDIWGEVPHRELHSWHTGESWLRKPQNCRAGWNFGARKTAVIHRQNFFFIKETSALLFRPLNWPSQAY